MASSSLFDAEPGDHLCVSYQDEDENRRLTSAHLAIALERGHRLVYVVDDGRAATVLRWLSAEAPVEPVSLMARGQLVVRQAEEFAFDGGRFDPDRLLTSLADESVRGSRTGYAGVRVCLAPDWVRRQMPGCERLLACERQVSTLLTDGSLSGLALVCQFDQARFPARALERLREAHPVALNAQQARQAPTRLRISPVPGAAGLRLCGEIDLSNVAEFSSALTSSFVPDRDFHLDLKDLRYMDVTAIGLLVKAAASLADGRRMVLRSPSPTIRTTLRVFGWDELPGLHLVEGMDG